MAALFLAVYAYQRRRWVMGSLLYSVGVGVKMSVLLAFPAIAVVLYQGCFLGRFFERAATHGVVMLGVQVAQSYSILMPVLIHPGSRSSWLVRFC